MSRHDGSDASVEHTRDSPSRTSPVPSSVDVTSPETSAAGVVAASPHRFGRLLDVARSQTAVQALREEATAAVHTAASAAEAAKRSLPHEKRLRNAEALLDQLFAHDGTLDHLSDG